MEEERENFYDLAYQGEDENGHTRWFWRSNDEPVEDTAEEDDWDSYCDYLQNQDC
jgi:hypothetical protein